uniref:TP53RK-binding protein n=1 Tax=Panagrolaimus sp. JU765 TaxID=591449 RepID=A0AC34RIM8_9BILA
MKAGISRLFELQPDPYDVSQRRYLRICLFRDVRNAVELRQLLRTGEIDAAFIRAELILEPFVLLAAANRAVFQASHNRLYTRSISAELIYSLSPYRNISDSLNTFGIAENSKDLIVAVFDDTKGDKMVKLAKKIEGNPEPLDNLRDCCDLGLIEKVYETTCPENSGETLSDCIVTRILSKDIVP